MCVSMSAHDTRDNTVCHLNKFLTMFGNEDYICSLIKFGNENDSKLGRHHNKYVDMDIHMSTHGHTRSNVVCHMSKSLMLFDDDD